MVKNAMWEGCSGKLRVILAAGLSLAMMTGAVPAQALEETAGDTDATQVCLVDGSTDELTDGLASEGLDVTGLEAGDEATAQDTEGLAADELAVSEDGAQPVANEADSPDGPAVVEPIANGTTDDEAPVAEATEEAGLASPGNSLSSQSTALVAQASSGTLPLDGTWVKGSFSQQGDATLYSFTVKKAGRLTLTLRNWLTPIYSNWTAYAAWTLYDAAQTSAYASGECKSQNPGTMSIDEYVDAGSYLLKVYSRESNCNPGGIGKYEIHSTFVAADSSWRTRNDKSSFQSSESFDQGKVYKSLFTISGADAHYWKLTLPRAATVSVSCEETISDRNPVSEFDIYDSAYNHLRFSGYMRGFDVEKIALSAGTYYVRVERAISGPYTIKWQAYDLADATVSLSGTSYTYDGKVKTPGVTVSLNGETLARDTDYTVSYSRGRKDVGTYKVIIKGAGNYSGSRSIPFTIKTRHIKTTAVSGLSKRAYTGEQIKPAVTVEYNGTTLKRGTDYTVSYGANKKLGKGTVIIKGKGNCTGTVTKTFSIVRASVKKARVAKVANKQYTGRAIKPTPKVTLGSKTLKRGRDYTLSYKDNKARGTATIIIKGKGNYKGTQKVNFRIV